MTRNLNNKAGALQRFETSILKEEKTPSAKPEEEDEVNMLEFE